MSKLKSKVIKNPGGLILRYIQFCKAVNPKCKTICTYSSGDRSVRIHVLSEKHISVLKAHIQTGDICFYQHKPTRYKNIASMDNYKILLAGTACDIFSAIGKGWIAERRYYTD